LNTCPEGQLHSYMCVSIYIYVCICYKMLLARSDTWLWGGEGLHDYWQGNCIKCPWLPKFRQFDSSLQKLFAQFSIPWERFGKYLCFAV